MELDNVEYFPNQVMAESTDFDLKIIFLDDLTKMNTPYKNDSLDWIDLLIINCC